MVSPIQVYYEDHRSQIRSGDLLAWSHDKFSVIGDLTLAAIRKLTDSDYGHVGITWKVGDRLLVIEATMPKVKIMPVSLKDEFYHVPVGLQWKKPYEEFLLDKVGLDYSIMDDIRAYYGLVVEDDNKWQCAELANRFYKSTGLDFGDVFEPGLLLNAIVEKLQAPVYKVISA